MGFAVVAFGEPGCWARGKMGRTLYSDPMTERIMTAKRDITKLYRCNTRVVSDPYSRSHGKERGQEEFVPRPRIKRGNDRLHL